VATILVLRILDINVSSLDAESARSYTSNQSSEVPAVITCPVVLMATVTLGIASASTKLVPLFNMVLPAPPDVAEFVEVVPVPSLKWSRTTVLPSDVNSSVGVVKFEVYLTLLLMRTSSISP